MKEQKCSCKSSDTILCIYEEFCSSDKVVCFSFGFFSFVLSAESGQGWKRMKAVIQSPKAIGS